MSFMRDVNSDTGDMAAENKEYKQLPLFVDTTMLPTKKYHISYSELSDWYECSHRHKLKHVEKIDMDGPSIHTTFGSLLHDALEQYVKTGKTPPIEEMHEKLKAGIASLMFTERAVSVEDSKEFFDAIEPLLEQAPKWLDEEFPGWKLVSAEEMLFEPIEGQKNKHFKGYIDLVIKVPKRKKGKGTRLSAIKGEVVPGEWVYWVIDWKTTNWGWRAEQKRSFQKHMQLIFYKHFWCTKHGIDLKDVRCGFAFLKRRPRKDGSRMDILTVSVGPKAVEKAMNVLHDCLNQIQAGMSVKNKMSCRFCKYAGTPHCP